LLSVGDDGPLKELGLFLSPVLLDKAFPLLAESRHPEVYVIGFLISDYLSKGMILGGTSPNSSSSKVTIIFERCNILIVSSC